jgi:hypothetical protein
MAAWWSQYVPAIPSDVDAMAKSASRISYRASRVSKIQMPAAAACKDLDGIRAAAVASTEVIECLRAPMARIYVEHDDTGFAARDDTDIGIWPG